MLSNERCRILIVTRCYSRHVFLQYQFKSNLATLYRRDACAYKWKRKKAKYSQSMFPYGTSFTRSSCIEDNEVPCIQPLRLCNIVVPSPHPAQALITGQLRIFRNVIKPFWLVSWRFCDFRREALLLWDPTCSKMSAAPFTVEMIFVFLLTLCLLHQYGNWRKQHWLVTIAVFIAWYFSFLIVFILPLDVSAVSGNRFQC